MITNSYPINFKKFVRIESDASLQSGNLIIRELLIYILFDSNPGNNNPGDDNNNNDKETV